MNQITVSTFAAIVVALTTALASAAPDKKPSADEALDELMKQWIAAHDQGDAQALAKFYVADANAIGIDGRMIKGREAIVKMYAAIFAATAGNKAKITLTSRRFVTADVAIDDGTWEVMGDLPEGAPKKGRYTTVLSKRDGKWRIDCSRSFVPWTGPRAKPE